MHKQHYKHYIYATMLFLLATIVGLWSWNTLSELFNLPQAQYKHIFASLCLMMIIKWFFSASHRSHQSVLENGHENQNS